jgi:hypothetical protein
MAKRGPKRLSAATLKARGSPLWSARAFEEQQAAGLVPVVTPKQYPLPGSLSKAAQAWGRRLMSIAHYDETEAHLLIELLYTWDEAQELRTFLQAHGRTVTDSKGIVRTRPEQRMLSRARQLLLSYSKELKIEQVP